ncbi:MAG: molecular chaperone TorD family protein [Burkholderiales bacterium]
MTSQHVDSSLAPEESARSDVYALLSRLFAAPADAALLHSIATIGQATDQQDQAEVGEFTLALRELSASAVRANVEAVNDEYHELFIGTGRPEIPLYTGAYIARSNVDRSLVALRGFLASNGLQRQTGVHEPEDHLAILMEIMRFLICEVGSTIEEQKQFFESFVWPGSIALCDAISKNSAAHFYRSTADFTKAFLFIEHKAFDM